MRDNVDPRVAGSLARIINTKSGMLWTSFALSDVLKGIFDNFTVTPRDDVTKRERGAV